MATAQTSREMTDRAGVTFIGRVMTAVQVTASLILLTFTSVVMFLVGLLTAFRFRRFYTEGIAAWLGRAMLRIWRVKFRLHALEPFPESETIYIANHPSTLDMFVLIGLGMPNTRYFMSSYLRYVLPMGLIGYTIGIFFAPLQRYPDRRVECFRNATEVLRTSRECVYLSPEGRRRPDGVGPFNKGAFHLATELGFPIVPLYIDVPQDVSPGVGLIARAGTVDVFVKPAIPTQDWKLSDLDKNREMVHDLFLRWEAEARVEP
jgi:1-acyl-sn-glycerol-3-phosphate acyltransferase